MLSGLFFMLFLCAVAASFIFWIWMLIDCLTKEPDGGNTKLIWVIVILFGNIVGAFIYFFVRRPERWQTVGR